MRELIRAPVAKQAKGDLIPSNEYDGIVYHLQAALQDMRDLPIGPLEEEKFRTWVYNLLGAAANLLAERYREPPTPKQAVNPQLRGDLDDILGGGEGDDVHQRVTDVPEVQEKPTGSVE